MTIAQISDVFMWISIINGGLVLVYFLGFLFAKNWIYKQHSRFFQLERSRFETIHYCFIGAAKTLVWFFNITPFIALRIAMACGCG